MDKIVIITGANSGIGKAAALKFAQEGYHVIMACRNMTMSSVAQKEIIATSKNNNVDLIELDVSSIKSIQTFCSVFRSKYPRLDILIHNAAYLNHGEKEYKLSPEGIELSFATNTFGPLYMTYLLLDVLTKSSDARVLNACTTNIKNFFDPKRKIEFDNLRGEYRKIRPYSSYKMYGDSKMALLMLTFKMAEEFSNKGIKVNALQINRVKLSKETIAKMKSIWKLLARLQNLTNPLPIHMANNYFLLCTSDEYSNLSGVLFNHKREIMQPATIETGMTQVKNILDDSRYPKYATKPVYVKQVWDMGQAILKEYPYHI